MQIDKSQIKERGIEGIAPNNTPVLFISTLGGLQSYWCLVHGVLECIGAAPHKAVAKWMAERKVPGIRWSEKNESV